MSNKPLILIDQPGSVFETSDFGQRWSAGNAEEGLRNHGGPRVDLALVEFSFVLPRLSAEDPGCYPIFTMARGGPKETFLRVTYEPSKALIHCGMNAGTANREPQWISLWPASPADYTKRVLRACVLIAPNALYASIEDAENKQFPICPPPAEPEELFGDCQRQWSGRVSDFPPWGVSPTGDWFISSGSETSGSETSGSETRQVQSFPPGFGLSDVRIELFGPAEENFGTMLYSGELDHLVKERR